VVHAARLPGWVLNLRTTALQKCEAVPRRLVFKAHRLLYHSTLGLRVIKKKKLGTAFQLDVSLSGEGFGFRFEGLGLKVEGLGLRVEGWGFEVEGSRVVVFRQKLNFKP